MAVEPDSEKRPTICMCVKGSALEQRGKFCKVDSKNVVIREILFAPTAV